LELETDEAAKSALNLSMSAVKCPATDLYSDVANLCQRRVSGRPSGTDFDEAAKSALNLSMSAVKCPATDVCSDVANHLAHALLKCNHYNVVRQRYFNVCSLHELFDRVNTQNILGFIRDIGLCCLL